VSVKLYDWETWLGGGEPKSVVLRRGVDYVAPQSTMVQQVRNAASRLGIKVSVKDRGDSLLIQTHPTKLEARSA
jgi:hypothetical protein